MTTRRSIRPVCVLLLGLSIVPGAALAVDAPPSSPQTPDMRPVILLTGFEPFGEDRRHNASWEGVKSLDGQTFHEYRLVCKQMRVEWGAPLEQLDGWIKELKPVAIFSFGQGGKSFTVESRASNSRGNTADNKGERPAQREIVAQGPREYAASGDTSRYARMLSRKGYPISLSSNAGRYLCEECLYTIEHEKARNKSLESVLFCHVPQLGTRIGDQTVNGEIITRFVKDVLDVWYASTHGDAAAASAQANEKAVEQVRSFIERYFSTWSKQDMAGYGDCFHADATIQFVDATGRVINRSKGPFVAEQAEYQGRTKFPADERPITIDIRIEAQLARAVVFWKLVAGTRTEFGYDHFTLINDHGRWKILNLVFYEARPE